MAEVNDVLSSDLYLFPFAAVRLKPWVKNAQSGLLERAPIATPFIPVGDCDDVKTNWTVERKTRKSRNQGTQQTVVNKVTGKELGVSYKAMQFTGFTRAMTLFADIAGLGVDQLVDAIEIGTEDQYDVEMEIEALSADGSQGTLNLYRVQLASEGDFTWAGGDDFAGADFKGTALSVPGLGAGGKASIGKFTPFAAA